MYNIQQKIFNIYYYVREYIERNVTYIYVIPAIFHSILLPYFSMEIFPLFWLWIMHNFRLRLFFSSQIWFYKIIMEFQHIYNMYLQIIQEVYMFSGENTAFLICAHFLLKLCCCCPGLILHRSWDFTPSRSLIRYVGHWQQIWTHVSPVDFDRALLFPAEEQSNFLPIIVASHAGIVG